MNKGLCNKLLCIVSIIFPLLLLATKFNMVVYIVGLIITIMLIVLNIRFK